MAKDTETIILAFEEMDLVYVALKERATSISALEKKAKGLELPKTEKASLSEGSKVKELMVKFLTPVRERIEEEEAEGGEEGMDE